MLSGIRLLCALVLALPVMAISVSHAAEPNTAATDAIASVGKLNVADVKRLIDGKEKVYIYDANERERYVAGHIPGARWVEYDAVTAAKLPKSKDATLVFYCYNPLCGASPLAAKAARALGYRNVWLMPEGITGWQAAHMPVVSGADEK